MLQEAQSVHFQKLQEASQKDIEQAFAVLQGKWLILATPAQFWSPNDMVSIIKACIILHNMIVEDRVRRETKEPKTWTLPRGMRLIPPRNEPYDRIQSP